MNREIVLIVDFGGSNNSQLIARKIRNNNIYCEVVSNKSPIEEIKGKNPKAIVIMGRVDSSDDSQMKSILALNLPTLTICGFLYLESIFDGKVTAKDSATLLVDEVLKVVNADTVSKDLGDSSNCVLNFAHEITALPSGFQEILSADSKILVKKDNLYATILDLEKTQDKVSDKIITNFFHNVCNLKNTWDIEIFVQDKIEEYKEKIGNKKVLCALSGGVDSTVCTALLHKAIGDNLTCIFVDHGLLRLHEADDVMEVLSGLGVKVIKIDAQDRFLSKLKGVVEPEEKRKIIGEEFIRLFEEEGKKIGNVDYLVQGTIYSDVIESGTKDHSLIKSHHNVGGLPDVIDFEEILEPVRDLFKDEVRKAGTFLGLPDSTVNRQAFPGPGLGVRVIGELTKEKLDILREADFIFREEVEKNKLPIWQYFAVMTDIKTVGVTEDGERSYNYTIALRAISSYDAMKATFFRIPYEILEVVSARITNEVEEVNRVLFDVTNKPPSCIEWE